MQEMTMNEISAVNGGFFGEVLAAIVAAVVLEAVKAAIETSLSPATQQILLDTGGGNGPSTAG